MLKKGKTTLFCLEKNNKILSGLYCGQFDNSASGWSQANDKNLDKNHSLRHFLEWSAIKFYHSNKYKFYEVGQTYFFDQNWHITSEKHKRIGVLKTRFGGDLYPRHYFRINKNDTNIFS